MNDNKTQANNSCLTHMACPDCDLIQQIPQIAVDAKAYCIRCNAVLYKNKKNSVDRSLAFAITGLILFVIANLFPLLSLKALGITQDGSLLATSLSLFYNGRPFLGFLILLTTIIFPLATLLGTIFILMQVKFNRINNYTARLFRFIRSTDAWGMLEIFMLAILVSVVKLGDLADVIYGVSLYAFCLLILSLTMLSHSLNPHDVWDKLREKQGCLHE